MTFMKTIKKYKDVDLRYCEQDGMIYFNFEDTERKVKYVFEAEQIIDEPVFEECDLYGYYVDGYFDKFIGLAKATKKDIKSGNPFWLFKGQYDTEFKRDRLKSDIKIYPRNQENDAIYNEWKEQKEIYLKELRKLNNITEKLI